MTDILELLGLRVSRQDIRDALVALGPPQTSYERTVHVVCQAVAAAHEHSAGAAPIDVGVLASLWREEEVTNLDVDCPRVDYEATARAVVARLSEGTDR